MMDILDMLLRPETPNVKLNLPTAEYEIKRLSKLFGQPAIFRLRALSFDRISELRDAPDMTVQVVLDGVVEPRLRDERLLGKYNSQTPAGVIKAMLLPGEIDALQCAIERLSGYRGAVIAEVRKNSKQETTGA